VGEEGSSPKERLQSITKITAPFTNILQQKNLPKVIQDLLGKVNDPRAIVVDTVTQQANLLAHIRYHKSLVRNGLKMVGYLEMKKISLVGVFKKK